MAQIFFCIFESVCDLVVRADHNFKFSLVTADHTVSDWYYRAVYGVWLCGCICGSYRHSSILAIYNFGC